MLSDFIVAGVIILIGRGIYRVVKPHKNLEKGEELKEKEIIKRVEEGEDFSNRNELTCQIALHCRETEGLKLCSYCGKYACPKHIGFEGSSGDIECDDCYDHFNSDDDD